MFAAENQLTSTHCIIRKRGDTAGNVFEIYHGVLITHFDIVCHADIISNQDLSRWWILCSPLSQEVYYKKVVRILKGESVAVIKVSIPIEFVNR